MSADLPVLQSFRPSPRYLILAAIGFIVAGLLAWEMRSGVQWETVFFCTIGGAGGLWASFMAGSRVDIDEQGVTLRRWLMSSRQVAYQQMIDADEVGHLTRVVVIAYYPRQASGLLDMDSVQTLALPTVDNQAKLTALLEERIPR